jgi:hypothetical protein
MTPLQHRAVHLLLVYCALAVAYNIVDIVGIAMFDQGLLNHPLKAPIMSIAMLSLSLPFIVLARLGFCRIAGLAFCALLPLLFIKGVVFHLSNLLNGADAFYPNTALFLLPLSLNLFGSVVLVMCIYRLLSKS